MRAYFRVDAFVARSWVSSVDQELRIRAPAVVCPSRLDDFALYGLQKKDPDIAEVRTIFVRDSNLNRAENLLQRSRLVFTRRGWSNEWGVSESLPKKVFCSSYRRQLLRILDIRLSDFL